MPRIKLITFAEAAAMLQPHMRADAAAWLDADSRSTPSQLRCATVRGRRWYSASEVAAFIVRLLNPEAVIDGVPRDASFAQRKRPERRQRVERRVQQREWPAHLERRKRPDRRTRTNRRGES